jgi:hypothetical protein
MLASATGLVLLVISFWALCAGEAVDCDPIRTAHANAPYNLLPWVVLFLATAGIGVGGLARGTKPRFRYAALVVGIVAWGVASIVIPFFGLACG